jgi:pimeloyl-ACP methyl ester carboxylesterase
MAMPTSSSDLAEVPISTGSLRPFSAVVESFDATRIHYDFYDAPSRSLILVVPGFWRFRRHPSMVTLATFLNGRGYRVAVVDVRGHGDSEGTYGFNLNEHHDVFAVAQELLRRLPVETITLVGLSYGGAISISTAARHPELPIGSLVLISPVADFSMIMPRINPFTIHRHIAWGQALHKPRFDWGLRRSAKLRAIDDVVDVHAPICLIHVKNDWLIGHTHSEALYQAANEPKELHVIDMPGNYHADRIFSVAGQEVEPMILQFLDKYAPR